MKGIFNISARLALLLLPLLVGSCGKEGSVKFPSEAHLVLSTGIDGGGLEVDTKGFYEKGYFLVGEDLGLFVLCSNDLKKGIYTPFQTGYNNMKVICTSETDGTGGKTYTWSFVNSSTGTSSALLSLPVRQSDNQNATVYAYAPHIPGATDPTAIPVDFTDNTDFLIATCSDGSNQEIDPNEVEPHTVNYSFSHAMSRISIHIRLAENGSDHKLEYITIKDNNKKDSVPLYSGGVFNVITSSFTTLNAVDSITFTVGEMVTSTLFRSFDYLIYPTYSGGTSYYTDGAYSFVFCIDGFRFEYPIMLNDLKHYSDDVYGFKSGIAYNFYFVIDNYVHLNGISLQNWSDDKDIDYNVTVS